MPLNPGLYSILHQKFGGVKVAAPGQRVIGSYQLDPLTGKPRFISRQKGEQYAVNCPFCNDTRKRLYFSYKWGIWDNDSNSFNYHLINCFNQDCIKAIDGAKDQLVETVLGYRNRNVRNNALQLFNPEQEAVIDIKARMPGKVIPLNELSVDHRANVYIRSRGFDPPDICKDYRVGFCTSAEREYSNAENRIIIPIYMHNELKGWQARYVGERDWKQCRFPKYYTMPGTKTGACLYNYDTAKDYNVVVVCEGPTDAWAVGPEAVSVFGKTLKPAQETLLLSTWGNDTIILLFDPDAEVESLATYDRLKSKVRGNLFRVTMPENRDAGSCDREFIWDIIESTAKREAIVLV